MVLPTEVLLPSEQKKINIKMYLYIKRNSKNKWKPPNLSKITQILFNMELTYLDSKASKNAIQNVRSF